MTTENQQEQVPSFKTKLIRGQTGGYGWEITVYGATTSEESQRLNAEALDSINKAINYAEQAVFYPAKPAK